MQAAGIVEPFNVGEQVTPRLGLGGVDQVVDALGPEGVEEAFHRGVVPVGALAAQGGCDP